ncbi:FecR family protein [Aeoliella sp. ICT_H6.2]|uniref:FecR family protein n=1 Tax=Aeoliella straminimaris TaxID=2954799 RepID=A0A9X2FGZ8_9BACT|nr:FecR family protein [Aeoliella straminimaris]MCO6044251.1 FecR family protein [Aeoliella straminimaris]
MTINQQRRLLAQFSRLCDSRLTEEEGRQLAITLRNSEEARIAYVHFLDLHASLDRDSATQITSLASLPGFDELVREGCLDGAVALPETAEVGEMQCQCGPRSKLSLVGYRPKHRRLQELLAASAVALLLGLVFWKLLDQPGPSATPPEYVASIISDANCTWDGLPTESDEQPKLRAGQQLALLSGIARLRFNDDTIVLIESPSRFDLVSPSSMRLHTGTVALRAEGEKKDFTVLAPNASIVDRGTSFGVHCGPDGVDVEVFEGKVEVMPSNDARRSQMLGLGASARIRSEDGHDGIDMFAADEGRFTDLLQMLWEDIHDRRPYESDEAEESDESDPHPVYPYQEFDPSRTAQGIDSFHGAKSGHGWITPWVAAGHPIGETAFTDALVGEGNPYLRLHFNYALDRTIAREYCATATFDPNLPHVISWLWRFDGQDEDFGDSFHDRVAFYANDYFRSNSASDISWFIGWAGDHEKVGKQRKTIPKRWFVFDGTNGSDYGPETLVDTGMELKPGVVYRMAVVLYPETKQYDAIIQDDKQTFYHPRLGYRNPYGHSSHVIHFSVGDDSRDGDASFSIDSIRVEPLRRDLVPKDLRFNVPVDPSTEGFST